MATYRVIVLIEKEYDENDDTGEYGTLFEDIVGVFKNEETAIKLYDRLIKID